MPTILSHAAVAVAGAYLFRAPAAMRLRLYALAAVSVLLPDMDVIGYRWLWIPTGHLLGHRGFFHSPFFAGVVSVTLVSLFFRRYQPLSATWWKATVFFFLLTASHGLLDAMTNGGSGIALLSPFSNERFFLPWTPIEVSPLGMARFFSRRGLVVLQSEALWIWLPLGAVVAGTEAARLIYRGRLPAGDPGRLRK